MKRYRYQPQSEPIIMTPGKLRKMLLGFPYPIIVTTVYLILGFLLRLWHPMWMLFLTIPIYYMLVGNMSFIEIVYSVWQRHRQDEYEYEDDD